MLCLCLDLCRQLINDENWMPVYGACSSTETVWVKTTGNKTPGCQSNNCRKWNIAGDENAHFDQIRKRASLYITGCSWSYYHKKVNRGHAGSSTLVGEYLPESSLRQLKTSDKIRPPRPNTSDSDKIKRNLETWPRKCHFTIIHSVALSVSTIIHFRLWWGCNGQCGKDHSMTWSKNEQRLGLKRRKKEMTNGGSICSFSIFSRNPFQNEHSRSSFFPYQFRHLQIGQGHDQ